MKQEATFTFAGASLGGTSVWECDLCKALVKEDGKQAHKVFHQFLAKESHPQG